MNSAHSEQHESASATLADMFSRLFERHFYFILFIAITALTFFAWTNRFMQDDAFISFRYAENLINGHGLVWNAGERIEGYTNFLWVIIVAAGMKIGIEPITFTYLLGIILFPTTLYVFFKLCRSIFESDVIGFIAVILLGTNYTFSIYTTGGLETHFLTLILVAAATITAQGIRSNNWNTRKMLALSFLSAGALLTRLDAAIPLSIIIIFVISHVFKNYSGKERIRIVVLLFLPVAVIVLSWLVWKLQYYGTILPNSFHAKTASGLAFEVGLRYIHCFFMSYFLYPVAGLLIFSLGHFLKQASLMLWMVLGYTIVWILYVTSVGGDFMEFRFMVTAIPFITILVVWLASSFLTRMIFRILLIGIVVGGNIHHIITFTYDPYYEIESRDMLHGHLYNQDEQWINVGKLLGEAFKEVPEATFAVTTAGAVPFYSKFVCIDMLGLNDNFVTREGMVLGTRPGHQRIAPLSYLMERKVNLVISHPTVVPKGQPPGIYPYLPRYPDEPLPNIPLIEIPLDQDYKIFIWYLNPTMRINTVIQQKGWKAFRPSTQPR